MVTLSLHYFIEKQAFLKNKPLFSESTAKISSIYE